jgi:glucosyl-dolichyl phosphate glucuronosyltransferase
MGVPTSTEERAQAGPAARVRAVSVVICAYTEGRWEQICAAVESIRRQSRPSAEIILVCDHNPALSARARAALPDVSVLENGQAKGLSGARNTGAAAAKGEIIAFLDDDAVAHEDWLKFLADTYGNPSVAGVGGLTLPRWQTRRPGWLPEEFYWVVGCNYRGMAPSGAPVRNLIGANMSFRKAVFELVDGGFAAGIGRTPARPLGCEETEFCIRLGQVSPGSLLVTDHRAMIWHLVSDSRCTFRYFLSRCFAEGVSKAQVTANVGSGDGLSAERSYTTRTLPLGVLRGVADLCRGDVTGLGRAAAIVAGLSVTTAGYARTKLGRAHRRRTARSPLT